MKTSCLLLCLVAATLSVLCVAAQESKPLLIESPLPVVASPDFKQPLDAAWKIAKGTYTPKDGVLTAAEVPADKHVAVLWHQVGLESAVIEFEFRLDGSKSLIVGCDGNGPKGLSHVGRVSIGLKNMTIAEDSVKPSHIIATVPLDVKPGVWHRLRVEWRGDAMAARLDGKEVRAQHAYLATPKQRSWLAVGGATAQLRELCIRGKKP